VLEAARRVAPDKTLWAVLQAFWAAPMWPRNPTPEELRAMTYLALNHGARGIVYFSWKSGDRTLIEHPGLWDEMKKLNGELRALQGPLLKRVRRPRASRAARDVTPHPLTTQSEIDVSFRRFGEQWLLIAVNPHAQPRRVTWRPGFFRGRTLDPLFETDAERVALQADVPVTLDVPAFDVKLFWIR
jgi:hypothetical protein